VGGDHEPRRVEGDVVERELDRRRAERADVERVRRTCTYTCTSVRYLTDIVITKIRAEPISDHR
jgi:hypothetical protein